MKIKLFIVHSFMVLTAAVTAQNNQIITIQQRDEAIQEISKALKAQYIFPEAAVEMAVYIGKQNKNKKYENLDGNAFAGAITNDLQYISRDKHINIKFSPEVLAPHSNDVKMEMTEEQKAGLSRYLRNTNYGIAKLEILPGNIGYIDINVFVDPEFAGDTYAAMMNYVAHTYALIIDLRHCGGSTSPEAIPFLCGYFFKNPVRLSDLYWRKGNVTQQMLTYGYVPGKKYLDKPVYILTSNGTFSGGEAIAYDLQNLKRATIIGQTTGGGANPGGMIRLTDHFAMFMPVGRAISPITHTNWEGIGVKPDIEVKSRLALHKAQELALEQYLKNPQDLEWGEEVKKILAAHKENFPKMRKVEFELAGYENAKEVYVAGTFNDWSRTDLMKRTGNKWTAAAEAEEGKILYKFIVDGQWMTDPANPITEGMGDLTNSVKN